MAGSETGAAPDKDGWAGVTRRQRPATRERLATKFRTSPEGDRSQGGFEISAAGNIRFGQYLISTRKIPLPIDDQGLSKGGLVLWRAYLWNSVGFGGSSGAQRR